MPSTGTPCPLCGGEARRDFEKNGYDIFRCRACKLAYVHPIPSDEELAAQYDDHDWFGWTSINRSSGVRSQAAADTLPAQAIKANAEYLEFAERRLGGPGRLLDVGCGNGPMLLCARERGWDVVGLETSKWAVQFCREALDLDVRRGVLEGNSLDPASFDLVTAIGSVEHMPRPVESLRVAGTLVRRGGLVAIAVPNDNALPRHLLGKEWRNFVPPSHLWYFNRRNIVMALEKAGLRAVHIENRSLRPREWRAIDRESTIAPAAETGGAIRTNDPKEMAKRVVRMPLQWLWMMESLRVWSVPAS
ncbi:MAG: class I SAM-dependent methyltransferase [Acidimicrobiia bacterium]|nr:class I SAM-dependent methyltransferase [Acidimicrobiia bacterium]